MTAHFKVEARPLAALRPHPGAGIVPRPSRLDYDSLKNDIAAHGQQDPMHVLEDGTILDGLTRYDILGELDESMALVLVVDVPANAQVQYIVDRAVNRRHLTLEQRQEVIRKLAKLVVDIGPKGERIGLTDKEIAEIVGVDERTVQRQRTGTTDVPPVDADEAPTHVRQRTRDGGSILQPKRQPRVGRMPTPEEEAAGNARAAEVNRRLDNGLAEWMSVKETVEKLAGRMARPFAALDNGLAQEMLAEVPAVQRVLKDWAALLAQVKEETA